MSRRNGFTVVELAVIFAILAVGIFIAITVISERRRSGAPRDSQLRGIHQAMVIFAQGNNSWFPGLDHHGNGNPTVEERFQLLLDANYFTGEYAISPAETKTVWTPGQTVTTANYSYSMLELNPGATCDVGKPLTQGAPHARRKEWRDTINGDAPILSDRNTGTAAKPSSIHTNTPGDWRGSVAYNDNHVVFETTHVIPKTTYAGVVTTSDDLFAAPTDSDALLIHSGTQGP